MPHHTVFPKSLTMITNYTKYRIITQPHTIQISIKLGKKLICIFDRLTILLYRLLKLFFSAIPLRNFIWVMSNRTKQRCKERPILGLKPTTKGLKHTIFITAEIPNIAFFRFKAFTRPELIESKIFNKTGP